MNPEDIFKKAQQQQNSRIIMPGEENQPQPDPLQMMAMEMQRLGMGLAQMYRTSGLVGKATDIGQLSFQMIFNLLIEKKIVDKDELEKLYQTEVIERYKKMEEDAKEYAEKEMKKQQTIERDNLKTANEDSEKASKAVISDAKDILNNVTPMVKKDD